MKDRKMLWWIYQCSKKQRIPMIILILGNALYASCGVWLALISQGVIDTAVAGKRGELAIKGMWLAAVIGLQFVLRVVCQNLEVRVQGRLEIAYKTNLFREAMQKDYSHITSYHSGDMMNRMTSDVVLMSEGVANILPAFAGLMAKLLSALIVLCMLDRSFMIIFTVSGLMSFFISRFLRKKLKHLHKNMQEKDGRVRSFIQEILESMLIIKVFQVEHSMVEKSQRLQQEHYQAKNLKNTFSILANSGFMLVFSIGYVYALIWGAFGVAEKTMGFGTLTAILQLVGQVQAPFAALSGLMPKVYGVIASAERLKEIEDLSDEPGCMASNGAKRNDQPGCMASNGAKPMDMDNLYKNMQGIEFEDVFFQYARDKVLENVRFVIDRGSFVAISGRSGIGKSTLLKLILGVFCPTSGKIHIRMNDGEKVSIDRNTRRLFAYVPQGNLLFSGTLRENITLVNPQVDEEDIRAALKMSCSWDFVNALPKRMETVIGEKGLGLSEGQAQRIAIARALLSEAPILLLDEATSALDEATERELLENIKMMQGRTCIIISHRKAVFAVCSKTLHMENKKVKVIEGVFQNEESSAYGQSKIV